MPPPMAGALAVTNARSVPLAGQLVSLWMRSHCVEWVSSTVAEAARSSSWACATGAATAVSTYNTAATAAATRRPGSTG